MAARLKVAKFCICAIYKWKSAWLPREPGGAGYAIAAGAGAAGPGGMAPEERAIEQYARGQGRTVMGRWERPVLASTPGPARRVALWHRAPGGGQRPSWAIMSRGRGRRAGRPRRRRVVMLACNEAGWPCQVVVLRISVIVISPIGAS